MGARFDRLVCWLAQPYCWLVGHDPEHPEYCPDWCARCDKWIGDGPEDNS